MVSPCDSLCSWTVSYNWQGRGYKIDHMNSVSYLAACEDATGISIATGKVPQFFTEAMAGRWSVNALWLYGIRHLPGIAARIPQWLVAQPVRDAHSSAAPSLPPI